MVQMSLEDYKEKAGGLTSTSSCIFLIFISSDKPENPLSGSGEHRI